jgi:hypothetical protein
VLAGGTPVSVDPDPGRARDAVRAAVAAELAGPTGRIHIEPLGISFPAGMTADRQDMVSRQLITAVTDRLA